MNQATEIEKTLRRLKPDLERKFHVSVIGLFGILVPDHNHPEHQVDLLVKFSQPVGWEFFELENFLELKLNRKVDITTASGIAPVLREKMLAKVRYI